MHKKRIEWGDHGRYWEHPPGNWTPCGKFSAPGEKVTQEEWDAIFAPKDDGEQAHDDS
jgi:hypothetical protein